MNMNLTALACGWGILVACHITVVKASDDTGGLGTTPRVTVTLLLLDSPSSLQVTNDLALLGSPISDPAQLSVGGKAYLETWCQTPGPNGISTAVVDVTYDTASFDTSLAQVSLASQWSLLAFDLSVDDQLVRVDDFGGNNLSGLGVAPNWAKIGTVEFDVTQTPTGRILFCSEFAGGWLTFAIRAEGSVQPVDVQYGCFALGCQLADFVACLAGPDEDVPQECDCADFDDDGDVDLRDFSVLQRQSVAPTRAETTTATGGRTSIVPRKSSHISRGLRAMTPTANRGPTEAQGFSHA